MSGDVSPDKAKQGKPSRATVGREAWQATSGAARHSGAASLKEESGALKLHDAHEASCSVAGGREVALLGEGGGIARGNRGNGEAGSQEERRKLAVRRRPARV